MNETLVGITDKTVLKKGEFCILLNPHDKSGKPQYGKKKHIEGPSNKNSIFI